MKDLGNSKTGLLAQRGPDDDLRESVSEKHELDSRLSDSPGARPLNNVLPFVPCPAAGAKSSVPFRWEETPGKVRASCRQMNKSTKDLQLKLPPRLQHNNISEFRRVTDQAYSRGEKIRGKQLNRRLTFVVVSQKKIGQMKSYVRAVTLQPRVIRCDFAREDSKNLEAALAGVGFSDIVSPAEKRDSSLDSRDTDSGSVSKASSTSSWFPDVLSPDVDGPGEGHKTRGKVAMERMARVVNTWVWDVGRVRRRKRRHDQAEMWSPTLATYLYDTRKAEAEAKAMEAENWAAFERSKAGKEEEEAGEDEQETEEEEEEDDSSSFDSSSVPPKSSSLPETDTSAQLSRPKRAFLITKTVRLLLGSFVSLPKRKHPSLFPN